MGEKGREEEKKKEGKGEVKKGREGRKGTEQEREGFFRRRRGKRGNLKQIGKGGDEGGCACMQGSSAMGSNQGERAIERERGGLNGRRPVCRLRRVA
jgi:hypothetical protein